MRGEYLLLYTFFFKSWKNVRLALDLECLHRGFSIDWSRLKGAKSSAFSLRLLFVSYKPDVDTTIRWSESPQGRGRVESINSPDQRLTISLHHLVSSIDSKIFRTISFLLFFSSSPSWKQKRSSVDWNRSTTCWERGYRDWILKKLQNPPQIFCRTLPNGCSPQWNLDFDCNIAHYIQLHTCEFDDHFEFYKGYQSSFNFKLKRSNWSSSRRKKSVGSPQYLFFLQNDDLPH